MKALGVWRHIVDLSGLNLHVDFTKLHMEAPQSVLRSVQRRDWMVSVDLHNAYLQAPVHLDSLKYLRFMSFHQTFHFQVLY